MFLAEIEQLKLRLSVRNGSIEEDAGGESPEKAKNRFSFRILVGKRKETYRFSAKFCLRKT